MRCLGKRKETSEKGMKSSAKQVMTCFKLYHLLD